MTGLVAARSRRLLADLAGGLAALITALILVVGLTAWSTTPPAAPSRPRLTVTHVPPPPPPPRSVAAAEPQPALLSSGSLPALPACAIELPSTTLVLPAVTGTQEQIRWQAILPALPLADTALPRVLDQGARRLVTPDLEGTYPHRARRYAIEGRSVLEIEVDDHGRVRRVVVVASEPAGVFDRAAERAARQLRYEPAVVDGQPVASTVREVLVWRMP